MTNGLTADEPGNGFLTGMTILAAGYWL